ncbi:patatin-like phospholipase family protein [Citricoccus sp. NPDC055426]|uniref:patatin-like phospholipase family protein n=1 Tax=Citricoccus sp. NPDC055426 TaxID=3155536 RepID=UPI003419FEF3
MEEEGLDFAHVDATSGGILNAAALLSGVRAEELIRRWRTVRVRDFASPLPVADYLRGPWNLPALSSPEGILTSVFPALGIDVARIRSSPVEGSFNVTDFTRKTSVALDASAVDAEVLAAGMSLPIFMTPFRQGPAVWTDAAWIRDANITEALDRGADEVWLIWCVGNSPYWGLGPLEQYVHMIEMSATGALLADFAVARAAGRPFVLHVIKPEHPLPLDPEFYLGRIDAETLIGMGYRDATAYLAGRDPGGVSADHTSTAMTEPPPGARWTERWSSRDALARLTVWRPSHDRRQGRVTGFVGATGWDAPAALADGTRTASSPGGDWTYSGRIRRDGRWIEVSLSRGTRRSGPRGRTASLRIGAERFPVTLSVRDATHLVASIAAFGAHGVRERAAAVVAGAGTALSSLLLRRGAAGTNDEGPRPAVRDEDLEKLPRLDSNQQPFD